MTYVLLIIAVALTFDFINGMHDSANSIATVVSTRVLTPLMAVFWAAFFNFIAAFTFGTAVAKTVGSGLIDVKVVNSNVVLGGLLGAIVWNLITWYVGIPSSSSHALIGGYAGAAVAKTIGSGLIDITIVNSDVVLGGLLGAITWNLVTWYFGLPSSSSHALIGGYAGAAVARVGIGAIVPGMAWVKTLSFIVLWIIKLIARNTSSEATKP